MNQVMLFTSTHCDNCKKMNPEWEKFLDEFENYKDLFPTNFIQHVIFNPNSRNAEAERKEIFKYAIKGQDGYPLLLFYINGKRWKPYWFDASLFRTSKSIMFSILVVYLTCPNLWQIANEESLCRDLVKLYWPLPENVDIEQICKELAISSNMTKDDEKGIYYLANWPRIKKNLQEQFDNLHSVEERSNIHYPRIDRIIDLEETVPIKRDNH